MAFVAGGEDLFQGHFDTFPAGAPGLKALDCGPAARALLGLGGHQVRNRLAMTGDCNGFSVLNFAEQSGKVSFCFGCLNFTHVFVYTG